MLAWQTFVEQQEQTLGKATVDSWLKSIEVVTFDSCNLYLLAKDPFHLSWFEEHIRPKLKGFVNNNHRPIKVHIRVNEAKDPETAEKKELITISSNSINPDYTFDTFISAEENMIPYKLLLEESNNEIPSFNPIFIYGKSASGKTHLLSAFANKLKAQGKKVFFVSGKTFTKHVVNAIRLGYMGDFRKTYRNVDCLIVDDIDFLENKKATQEEFFHTFNTLHTEGKILLLSAREAPSGLKEIEPRLISRFEWGIQLNLEPLKKENIPALLSLSLVKFHLSLDDQTKEFLSDQFENDLHGLKKAIEAIILRSHIENADIKSLSGVKHMIADLINIAEKKKLCEESLVEIVSNYFQIAKEDLLGKRQGRAYAFPRQMAMFFLREFLNLSYSQIGKVFLRDHSTVISSIKKIKEETTQKKEGVIKPLLEIKKLLETH
jgi:chromosomal replication initiator protein